MAPPEAEVAASWANYAARGGVERRQRVEVDGAIDAGLTRHPDLLAACPAVPGTSRRSVPPRVLEALARREPLTFRRVRELDAELAAEADRLDRERVAMARALADAADEREARPAQESS